MVLIRDRHGDRDKPQWHKEKSCIICGGEEQLEHCQITGGAWSWVCRDCLRKKKK